MAPIAASYIGYLQGNSRRAQGHPPWHAGSILGAGGLHRGRVDDGYPDEPSSQMAFVALTWVAEKTPITAGCRVFSALPFSPWRRRRASVTMTQQWLPDIVQILCVHILIVVNRYHCIWGAKGHKSAHPSRTAQCNLGFQAGCCVYKKGCGLTVPTLSNITSSLHTTANAHGRHKPSDQTPPGSASLLTPANRPHGPMLQTEVEL